MEKKKKELFDRVNPLLQAIDDLYLSYQHLVSLPPQEGWRPEEPHLRKVFEGREVFLPEEEKFIDAYWPGDPSKRERKCKHCGVVIKGFFTKEERGDWREGDPLEALYDALLARLAWLREYFQQSFLASAGLK